jgi:TfdA family taurine catabolism dioxygenase TauD
MSGRQGNVRTTGAPPTAWTAGCHPLRIAGWRHEDRVHGRRDPARRAPPRGPVPPAVRGALSLTSAASPSTSLPGSRSARLSNHPPHPSSSSDGASDAESRHLLELFYAHIIKPEHIVRHRWQPGDVAMWDNRATVHYANRDYGDARRVMHRITLRGDEPSGVETLR